MSEAQTHLYKHTAECKNIPGFHQSLEATFQTFGYWELFENETEKILRWAAAATIQADFCKEKTVLSGKVDALAHCEKQFWYTSAKHKHTEDILITVWSQYGFL